MAAKSRRVLQAAADVASQQAKAGESALSQTLSHPQQTDVSDSKRPEDIRISGGEENPSKEAITSEYDASTKSGQWTVCEARLLIGA